MDFKTYLNLLLMWDDSDQMSNEFLDQRSDVENEDFRNIH